MWKVTRGNNWSDDEVKNLIDIWKEPVMRERIDSKKRFKMDTWSEIANRLVDLGYPTRTGAQVHNKIKDLRRMYHKARVDLTGSGPGLNRQFPYYHLLSEVMRSRPTPGSQQSPSGIGCDGDDDDDSSIEGFDETNSSNSINYVLSGEESNQIEDKNLADAMELIAEGDIKELQEKMQQRNTTEASQAKSSLEKGVDDDIVIEEPQASSSGTAESRTGKKRQKVTMKDKTVEALAKKMKEITAASDRKFLIIEEKRRKEELEQRKEDRKCMLHMMELIKQGMEDRRIAEEKRSKDFQALMDVLGKHAQQDHGSTS